MKKEHYETFRGLLRGAICNRTQAEFAKAADLSPEHVNRMLNKPDFGRPTKSTLLKIASAAKNGITYQMLMQALDEEDGVQSPEDIRRKVKLKEAQEDFKEPFEDLAYGVYVSISRGMGKFYALYLGQGKPEVAESIGDFVEEFLQTVKENQEEKYANLISGISYDVGLTRDYYGTNYPDAKQYTTVYFSLTDGDKTAESQMVLYHTKVGEYFVIQHASMAVCDLFELYGMADHVLEQVMDGEITDGDYSERMQKAMKLPIYVDIKAIERFREPYRGEDMLETILGKEVHNPQTIYGTGFWLTELPPKFYSFIARHKKAVLSAYQNRPEAYEELHNRLSTLLDEPDTDGMQIASMFNELEYEDEVSFGHGWRNAIAQAMYQETGFPFEALTHVENDDYPWLTKEDALLIPEWAVQEYNISRETLLTIVCKYGKELGLKTFGDITFKTLDLDFRKDHMYNIKYREETDGAAVEMEPDHHWIKYEPFGQRPGQIGIHDVMLKDGRIIPCMYLPEKDHWVFMHKEWSGLLDAYSEEPKQFVKSEDGGQDE